MTSKIPISAEKLNSIGGEIIGSAFEVRKHAGKLLREMYYKYALAHELREKGYKVDLEVLLPAFYKGKEILNSFRMDLIVEDCVIVEVKALHQVGEEEFRQLLTYLHLSKYKLGYLINFGADDFSIATKFRPFDIYKGIFRFVNNI